MAARSSDRYAELVRTGAGAAVARRLGLPRPARLRRYEPGAPLLGGPALVLGAAGGGLDGEVAALLRGAGADVRTDLGGLPDGVRLGAVVADARALAGLDDVARLGLALGAAVRRLGPSARLLVVGADPVGAPAALAAARQALEGLVRTAGKELRAGATANLLLTTDAVDAAALAGPLRFLASARSAFVDGQVVRVGAPVRPLPPHAPDAPLAGQVAVVTGAARGIGAATAGVLARAGAHVVAVDVPAAGEALAGTANRVRGTALALDVTAPGAPARLVAHLADRHGGADVVVHNAGTTRDRLLVNLDAARWATVLGVNLAAPVALTGALLAADGALRPGARLVAVSSTSGLAGNRGQANYAASKAGVAGWVRALAGEVAGRGVSVNAVAPGFVETEMTARMPVVVRELGRRASSLGQGGLPVDVAEAIAWLAEPASAGVTGQVLRVCGQALVGA